MKSTDYSSKINELMTIKERKKLLREIQERKRRLLYSNPQTIAPFIRDKVADTLLRNSYPSIRRSPISDEKIHNINPPIIRSDNGEYLALMREHRSIIENELSSLRREEENNRRELERSLKQLIESNGHNNNNNVAEIRSMLKSFHETQLDIQRDSHSSDPVVRDLRRLKTNYLLDGGHDPHLLAEMDSVIKETEKNKTTKASNDNYWINRRKDLVLAREKSHELIDLERQNAEMERQLDLSRVRSERKMKTNERSDGSEKMEILQRQIEALQTQILNLQNPQNSVQDTNQIPITSVPIIPAMENKRNIAIIIDFISGIGIHIRSIRIIISIFHGLDKVGNSLVTDTIPVRQRNITDLDSSALVNIRHPVISCPSSPEIFALVELQVVTDSSTEPRVEGWTKICPFNYSGELKIGKWKQCLLKSPVQMKATSDDLLRIPRYHRTDVHYRCTLYSSDEDLNTVFTQRDYEQPTFEYTKPNPFALNNDARDIDVASDDERSDVTMDLDERPEIGFQMIRVKNMIIGDGLEFAKIRMTVYHTEGAKKGQIVMSSDGPVTCSTNAVRADFKNASYNLGRQLAKFTNVDLSADCIVFARFYLEGEASLRNDTDLKEMEERLVAWTAMSVIKRRTAARLNPSYVTDSLKLLRINRGIHDLSLYEPPALPPTMVFFDRKGFIVGQKAIGRTKLKFRLFHTQIVYDSATSSDDSSMDEDDTIGPNALKPWIPVDRAEPPLMSYHQDEGVDLYIDSGRLFPDSVTLIKIEGSIVDRHLKSQGPQFSAFTSLSSDIYNPIFNQRTEVREPHLTPSSTLLLKIMTFDREEKNLVVLGYASLKLFIETGTGRQPHFDNLGVLISLNDGCHQLRIYLKEPTIANGPFTEDWFQRNRIQPIPGASLLLRIYKPPKNADGKSINIDEVPRNYQDRLGVIVPAPAYQDGFYYSMNCKPTEGEYKIMKRHSLRPIVLLQDLILSQWAESLMPEVTLGETSESNNIYRLFDMFSKDAFKFNHIAHYAPTNGFKISIDGALNLPWSGYPMGHVCIYPPGAIYMQKPLMAYDRPFFLSKLDLLSTQSSPIWVNGWKSYRRRRYDKNLIAILHLHEMKVTVVKNNFVFTLENQAWTPIRIFDGPYCITASTQMALLSGSPSLLHLQELTTKTIQQFLLDNIPSKKIVPLQLSSVIVRQCDSRRHLEIEVSADNELLTLDQSNLPQDKLPGYRTVLSSNNDIKFNTTIPIGFAAESFQELLRVKFKSLIFKLYEQGGFVLS